MQEEKSFEAKQRLRLWGQEAGGRTPTAGRERMVQRMRGKNLEHERKTEQGMAVQFALPFLISSGKEGQNPETNLICTVFAKSCFGSLYF